MKKGNKRLLKTLALIAAPVAFFAVVIAQSASYLKDMDEKGRKKDAEK